MNPTMWQNAEGCTFCVCPNCAATILTRYLILIVGRWSNLQKSYFQKQHVLRAASHRYTSHGVMIEAYLSGIQKSVDRLKLLIIKLEKQIQYFRVEIHNILLGSPITRCVSDFIRALFYFAVPSARKRIFY